MGLAFQYLFRGGDPCEEIVAEHHALSRQDEPALHGDRISKRRAAAQTVKAISIQMLEMIELLRWFWIFFDAGSSQSQDVERGLV
jgi:hypothetical protein